VASKRKEILRYLRDHKKRFRRRYRIDDLILFGSFARDSETETSDVDIALRTENRDLFSLMDLKEELEKAFSRPVDLVRIREKMNPYLKRRIFHDGIHV